MNNKPTLLTNTLKISISENMSSSTLLDSDL